MESATPAVTGTENAAAAPVVTPPSGGTLAERAKSILSGVDFTGTPVPVKQEAVPTPTPTPTEKAPEASTDAPKNEEKAVEATVAETTPPVQDTPVEGGNLRSLLMGGEVKPIDAPKEALDWLTPLGLTADDVVALPATRERIAAVEQERDTYKGQVDALTALPVDVKNMVVALMEGKTDAVEKFLSTPRVSDWSKPFASQDPEAMLAAFAAGKVTKEDIATWKDPDGDPMVKRMVDGHLGYAKVLYEREAAGQLTYAQSVNDSHQKRQQALVASQATAINNLTKMAPEAVAYKDILSRELTPQGWMNLAFDKDGNFKPNAALTFIRANEDLFKQVTAAREVQVVKQAKEDAQIEAIAKTSERPEAKKPAPQPAPATQGDRIRHLAQQMYAALPG